MPPEPMTDDDVRVEVDRCVQALRDAQRMVADSLSALAAAAQRDARAVLTVPPEAMTWTYLSFVDRVRAARVHLDNARADLTAWGTELNRREGLVP
jgi:hypothetical protein